VRQVDAILARPLLAMQPEHRSLIKSLLNRSDLETPWLNAIWRGRNFSLFGPQHSGRILTSLAKLIAVQGVQDNDEVIDSLYHIVNSDGYLGLTKAQKQACLDLHDTLDRRGRHLLGELFRGRSIKEGLQLNPQVTGEKSILELLYSGLMRVRTKSFTEQRGGQQAEEYVSLVLEEMRLCFEDGSDFVVNGSISSETGRETAQPLLRRLASLHAEVKAGGWFVRTASTA